MIQVIYYFVHFHDQVYCSHTCYFFRYLHHVMLPAVVMFYTHFEGFQSSSPNWRTSYIKAVMSRRTFFPSWPITLTGSLKWFEISCLQNICHLVWNETEWFLSFDLKSRHFEMIQDIQKLPWLLDVCWHLGEIFY